MDGIIKKQIIHFIKIKPILLLITLLFICNGSLRSEVFEKRVATGSDDAEEYDYGRMYLTSSDLELVEDSRKQTVGIRFQDVNIPKGAIITGAYIQFKVDETSSGGTTLIFTDTLNLMI